MNARIIMKTCLTLTTIIVVLSCLQVTKQLSLVRVDATGELKRHFNLTVPELDSSCLELICDNLTCGATEGGSSVCYHQLNEEPCLLSCNISSSEFSEDDEEDTSPPVVLHLLDEETVVLLNSSVEDVKKIPRDTIVSFLWAINRLKLHDRAKFAVWEIIKDGRSPQDMTVEEIQDLGDLVLSVPDRDLYLFNLSDWSLVEYLGQTRGFTRRQFGVLAHSLQKQHDDTTFLSNVENINRIFGILCGFPTSELEAIKEEEVYELQPDVFYYLDVCSDKQKQVILRKMTSMTVFGVPSGWSANDTNFLGPIVSYLSPEELSSIRPIAVAGFAPEAVKQMNKNQLMALSQNQLEELSVPAMNMYRRRTGIMLMSGGSSIEPRVLDPTMLLPLVLVRSL